MATKKKVAKKKKATPKPSTLLEKALALFGPKGENWITGSEKQHRDAGFLYKGQVLDVDDAIEKIKDLVNDDPTKLAGTIKEFVPLSEADTFCSIEAIFEVNTPNQGKAVEFLARAIDPNYSKHAKIVHNKKSDAYPYDGPSCKCNDCANRDAHSIITGNNDDLSDDPDERMASFKVIKSWFTKAIKLAKAANQ